MAYKPYPIYDYKTGLKLAREPWLIPKDAWQRMNNAYLWRGKIQKRGGYSEFHPFVHFVDDEALDTTVDATLTYSGTLSNTPVDDDSEALTITDDGGPHETFTDNGDGTLTGDAGGSGTINYSTGAWEITYNSNPGNGLSITADYNYNPGNAIMGIYNFYTQAGSSQLILFDEKRANKYDAVNDELVDIVETDTFTGGDSDFFWCENWKDKLWITNNIDRMQTWDGSTWAEPDIDISDDAQNDLDTCLLIFAYKDRLVLLRPTEDGTSHPQRARWCTAGDPTDWTNDGYVDAPTLDWIMGADFLGDDLIVFFERSIWRLKYTSDVDLPFRWEKIVDTEGCYATHSCIAFSDEVITLGPVSFLATDGMDAYNVNEKIPDAALDINQEGFDYVYAFIIEENRQIWVSYPSIDATDVSDHVLVLNYEDDAWSKFDLGFSCFGYWEESDEPTWDDMEDDWDEVEWRWDDRVKQAGYPLNLAGDSTGTVWKLEQGTDDDGSAIELDLLSGDWNPFYEQGYKCRLGWVDIFVERDPDTTLTFKFWAENKSEGAYVAEQDIDLDDDSGEDDIWIRVPVNVTGESVTMQIYHNTTGANVTIHAIVPYFAKAGAIGYG